MRVCIQLDKYDIEKIIAEHFGVNLNKVKVEPYIGITGCGMDETETAFVRAEIAGDFSTIYFNEHYKDDHFNEYHKDDHPADNYGCYT